jgi:peptide/nickel transport system permease protein
MTREHIMVGKAAGISRRRLVRRHAVPQVQGPVLVMLGMEFGAMFGGAILVESIFGRDGLGSYLTAAVSQKDTTAVLGGVLTIGVVVVLVSLAVDIIQMVRDPRIRSAELAG